MTICVFIIAFISAVLGAPGSGDEQIVKKLRYPEYDAQGRLNFELMGDEAAIRPDGLIRIVNLVLVFYEDGEVVMRVKSPSCLFDRMNRTAVSTSTVSVTRSEVELTGRGFEWNGKDGGFRILEDARVILNTGRQPEDDEP